MRKPKAKKRYPGDCEIELGTCCICGGSQGVRNILMLNRKSPKLGRGWGCVVCHLPPDGAVAVLCDECFESDDNPAERVRFVCTGYPESDGRTPISQVQGTHEHDMSYHVGSF